MNEETKRKKSQSFYMFLRAPAMLVTVCVCVCVVSSLVFYVQECKHTHTKHTRNPHSFSSSFCRWQIIHYHPYMNHVIKRGNVF